MRREDFVGETGIKVKVKGHLMSWEKDGSVQGPYWSILGWERNQGGNSNDQNSCNFR